MARTYSPGAGRWAVRQEERERERTHIPRSGPCVPHLPMFRCHRNMQVSGTPIPPVAVRSSGIRSGATSQPYPAAPRSQPPTSHLPALPAITPAHLPAIPDIPFPATYQPWPHPQGDVRTVASSCLLLLARSEHMCVEQAFDRGGTGVRFVWVERPLNVGTMHWLRPQPAPVLACALVNCGGRCPRIASRWQITHSPQKGGQIDLSALQFTMRCIDMQHSSHARSVSAVTRTYVL